MEKRWTPNNTNQLRWIIQPVKPRILLKQSYSSWQIDSLTSSLFPTENETLLYNVPQ